MSWFRRTPLADAVWAVVDCETSGLDPKHDRLLSVAAIAVAHDRVVPARSYSALLRQDAPSDAGNILVHGIGGEAQLGGRSAQEVLAELAAFIDDAIPVAFHAPFDRAVLARAFATARVKAPTRRWLDLATLAPAFFPDRKATDLDSWLAAFGIECTARHDALSDAYATAQLLLVALAKARREGVATVEALLRLARSGAWLRSRR